MQRTQAWARRKDRHPVEIEAVVQRTDGRKQPVKLSNFSDEGCRIETDDDYHIGERLQIAIPRMGHIKAQVRWSMPGSIGARFLAESDF
jgi:hypothetical protein